MENNSGGSGSGSSNSILRNCITKVSNLFRSKSTVSKNNRLTNSSTVDNVETVEKFLSKSITEPILSDSKIDIDNVTLRHQNSQPQADVELYNQDNNGDIDKSLVAENEDVVTPLPVCNSKPFAFGNGIRPEVVEIIKNMDSKSLRINNLTAEDRTELMKRYGKEDKSVVFRNSNSCPSFSSTTAGLYERRIRENEQRLRLNILKSEVFI